MQPSDACGEKGVVQPFIHFWNRIPNYKQSCISNIAKAILVGFPQDSCHLRQVETHGSTKALRKLASPRGVEVG